MTCLNCTITGLETLNRYCICRSTDTVLCCAADVVQSSFLGDIGKPFLGTEKMLSWGQRKAFPWDREKPFLGIEKSLSWGQKYTVDISHCDNNNWLLFLCNEISAMHNRRLDFDRVFLPPTMLVVHRESYDRVIQNMRKIGFLEEELEQVLSVLAAVLHIGDIVSQHGTSTDDKSSLPRVDFLCRTLHLMIRGRVQKSGTWRNYVVLQRCSSWTATRALPSASQH